jgi:hypothetical protein
MESDVVFFFGLVKISVLAVKISFAKVTAVGNRELVM